MATTGERFLIYGDLAALVEGAELLERHGEHFLLLDPAISNRKALSHALQSYNRWYTSSTTNNSSLARFEERFIFHPADILGEEPPTVIIGLSLAPIEHQLPHWQHIKEIAPDAQWIISTLAFTATAVSHALSTPAVIGFNGMPGWTVLGSVELTCALGCPVEVLKRTQELLASLGITTEHVEDRIGLVLPRILTMLINEAAFAVMERIASPADIDRAVKLGVNYPHGLLEWADRLGLERIVRILDALYEEYREPRYRACPLLRQYVRAQWTGVDRGKGFFTYQSAYNAATDSPA
ncbi:MAG: 3-hydroxyacyl-CoA dehydrogenase family protein [Candidatus Kapabacteria bacterium]|nr:3-hydroxyacyl-CoA dehydrogenase family protein [Candidatus Kapabacteria bacterium]